MPKLGVAAIPWIALFVFAPVIGEQIKLPGLERLIWACADLAALVFLVLRRDPVDHDHFTAPSALPVIGAGACIVLAFDKDAEIWARAGLLLVLGLALWTLNWLTHGRHQPRYDTETLEAVARPS